MRVSQFEYPVRLKRPTRCVIRHLMYAPQRDQFLLIRRSDFRGHGTRKIVRPNKGLQLRRTGLRDQ